MSSEASETVYKDAENIYNNQEIIKIVDNKEENYATKDVDSAEVVDFKSEGTKQIYPHGIKLGVIIASLAASVFLVALVR